MAEDRILAVRFESAEDFRREFDADIANGGIFVATLESVDLRERVSVGIELVWCGEAVMLEGEVVHRVPPELAPAGVTPGVAVQFDLAGSDLRARLEPFLEPTAPEQPPRPADRRDAARGTARVPALLRLGDDELLDGRTRNLSASGLLFAIEGVSLEKKAVRKGQAVTVFLKHPETLEDMVIPGTVARRLFDEQGAVRALGVRFGDPAELPAEVRAFLTGLQRREHARSLGGVGGELEAGGCAPLLERFAQAAPEGTLILTRGAEEGFVAVREGRLLDARLGSARGRKALVRLLAWETGRYEFHTRVDPDLSHGGAAPRPLEATLLDAAREVDELRRLRAPGLPPDQRLRPVPAVVAGLDPDKLESAVLDLASVGQPLGRLLEVIPEPDLAVYAAVDALLDEGALEPVDG